MHDHDGWTEPATAAIRFEDDPPTAALGLAPLGRRTIRRPAVPPTAGPNPSRGATRPTVPLSGAPQPRVSRPADTTIVVPTFNEGGNVPALVQRLTDAFAGWPVEILFVDDSTDDTADVIRDVAATAVIPVRLIARRGEDKIGGLAGAVTAGIRASAAEYVLVMDGDQQHPPEMAPRLREVAGEADLAVASRYLGTGDASGLSSRYRVLVSSGSTMLAKACFPKRVGAVCTDPMTGFFCVRRAAIDMDRLRPRGFKILLEILARHDLRVVELPFVFGERTSGESKANWRNGAQFCYQMASLRMGKMSRFAAVGLLGTLVNLGLMAMLVHGRNSNYLLASVVAAEVSILFNFVLQELFVFHDALDGANNRRKRAGTALFYNNVETIARLPVLMCLVSWLGLPAVLAQGVTLAVAFFARFLFMSRIVYRPRPVRPVEATPAGRHRKAAAAGASERLAMPGSVDAA